MVDNLNLKALKKLKLVDQSATKKKVNLSGRRVLLRICSDPVLGGYMPLIRVVRAGAHTGAVDQQLRYIIPLAAKPSR